MLIDCCLYHDEAALLELRVRTLAPVVDVFLVVTCTVTHQGEPCNIRLPVLPVGPRVSHYEVNPQLRHENGRTIGVDDRGGYGSDLYMWIERQQRDGIWDAVRAAGVVDLNDLVMVSDVDEIPNVDVVGNRLLLLDAMDRGDGWAVLEMRNHSTSLDLLNPHQPELTTTIARWLHLYAQPMRDARAELATRGASIADGGIHLSWFGTDDDRQRKLDSFSHAEHRHWSPVEGRRTRTHINGEQLRKLNADEMRQLAWPAPLTDGSFVIPPDWFEGDPVPLTDESTRASWQPVTA